MALQAKISERSKKIVQRLAEETGESQIAIIEHAVMAYHHEWKMKKLNETYENLRKDKQAWQEELEERALLEQMSEDGLEDE